MDGLCPGHVNDTNGNENGTEGNLKWDRGEGREKNNQYDFDNLFGERYNSSTITNAWGGRYYEPSPGREIYVGLSVGFGVQ